MDLDALQKHQQLHDEECHCDILGLPLERRLAHLIIHLSKYVGRLALAKRGLRETQSDMVTFMKATLSDTLLITLSAANASEIALALDMVSLRKQEFHGYGEKPVEWFCHELAICVGKMAKIYDDHDHGLSVSFPASLGPHLAYIMYICEVVAEDYDIDLVCEIKRRWRELEQKQP